MPRKRKSPKHGASEEAASGNHRYVTGKVAPGYDAPVVDLYLEFAEESFEDMLMKKIREAELLGLTGKEEEQ